jgi:hypothetical protein
MYRGWEVKLTREELQYLCNECSKIFLEEQMLLELEAPIKICGT